MGGEARVDLCLFRGKVLFASGLGLSWVGVPSISAAYSSVRREDLPLAATAMNIVMRMGGPTLTTVCATFLGWRLGLGAAPGAFAAAFVLLCGIHAALIAAAFRLPRRVDALKTVSPPSPGTLGVAE